MSSLLSEYGKQWQSDRGVDTVVSVWYNKNMTNNNNRENKMSNDYENVVKHLMAKGYNKSEARGEAWKCIARMALKHELARNDVHSDEWMSTEELSEFGLTR